jgi:hypothetical protein
MRVVSPVDAETDDTENESSSQKTVTLRSGRKVKVPSWRKSVLEDALKTIRHKSAVLSLKLNLKGTLLGVESSALEVICTVPHQLEASLWS